MPIPLAFALEARIAGHVGSSEELGDAHRIASTASKSGHQVPVSTIVLQGSNQPEMHSIGAKHELYQVQSSRFTSSVSGQ